MSILVIGMATVDVIFENVSSNIMKLDKCSVKPPKITTGGDALNVSKILSILGENVSLISSIGLDDYGNYILSELDKYKIKNNVNIQDSHTAVSYVLLDEDKERHFVSIDEIFDEMKLNDDYVNLISDYNYIYYGSSLTMKKMDEEYLLNIMKVAKKNGATTFMDAAVNYDVKQEQIDIVLKSLKYVDYFIPSIEEMEILTKTRDFRKAFAFFQKYECKNVIVKSGSNGVYILDYYNPINIPVEPVKRIVDTTGAGDSFVGGFIKSIKNGSSLEDACRYGNSIARKTIQTYGVEIKI